MFGRSKKTALVHAPPPPAGISEIILCVFDEKQRVRYGFMSIAEQRPEPNAFQFLNHPELAFENGVLTEAVASHQPVSLALSYGCGLSKYLYVLPYERKRNSWRFVCMQITVDRPNPDAPASSSACNMADEQVFFLLADSRNMVYAASSTVPEALGYTAEMLKGMNLSDFFGPVDLGMINSCSPDTNQAILSCVFNGLDGSRRDVEVRKYSAIDGCTLYGICDVTRPQLQEEVATVSMRERRRIGQDLHDSIGQIVTGMSLLSRSLANGLQRDGHPGHQDAAQISELADDASNQIRQISRGLMPSDIVNRGLFAALHDLARLTQESSGITCEARLDESIRFGDGAVETHLYRIAQEAVNNAVRHSGATRIDIVVAQENGIPELLIQDNGRWQDTAESPGGIGMKTMEYRASVINGLLHIRGGEDGGTSVVCRMEVDELMETKA